jgi:hypothetical protein
MPDKLLHEEHYQLILKHLAELDEADRHIEMAKRAGIAVEHHEAASKQARSQLQNIRQVYFPGR